MDKPLHTYITLQNRIRIKLGFAFRLFLACSIIFISGMVASGLSAIFNHPRWYNYHNNHYQYLCHWALSSYPLSHALISLSRRLCTYDPVEILYHLCHLDHHHHNHQHYSIYYRTGRVPCSGRTMISILMPNTRHQSLNGPSICRKRLRRRDFMRKKRRRKTRGRIREYEEDEDEDETEDGDRHGARAYRKKIKYQLPGEEA